MILKSLSEENSDLITNTLGMLTGFVHRIFDSAFIFH